MGNATDHATRAAGVSILFLLAIILLVLGGCLRFIWFLAKCEKAAVKVKATPPSGCGTETSFKR